MGVGGLLIQRRCVKSTENFRKNLIKISKKTMFITYKIQNYEIKGNIE